MLCSPFSISSTNLAYLINYLQLNISMVIPRSIPNSYSSGTFLSGGELKFLVTRSRDIKSENTNKRNEKIM